jgi:hypothetical protein
MSGFNGLGPTSSFGYADFAAAGVLPSQQAFAGSGSLLGSAMSTGSLSGPGYGSAINATNPLASQFAAQDALDQAQSIQTAGMISMIGGAVTQQIASYYQAKQAQYEAKSKASSMRFQADMADISASMAMEDAASILEAGQQQKAQLTMRAGLEMAQELTRQGARGVRIGAGSAAETQASLDLVKEIDAYNIDTNALRQSQARRMQAVNLRAQGRMGRVSASNLEQMARPAELGTTLLSGAGRVGSEYMLYRAQQENRNPRYNYLRNL